METGHENNINITKSRVEFSSKEENLFYPGVYDIDPLELAQMLNSPDYLRGDLPLLLVDVRQREEYHGELGRVPRSELHVLDQLDVDLPRMDKNTHIVFICRSGSRSARASEYALSLGFRNTYNLKGGMLLWNELRLPVEHN